MDKVNNIALYVGLAIGAVFMAYGFLKGESKPRLNQVVMVILASTGATVGFHLGYLTLTLDDKFLGKLASQKIPIVLGALAVVWTSIETLWSTFKAIVGPENQKENTPNPSMQSDG